MKPVKAIDLVWRAQPMIATLHTIMVKLAADAPGKSASGTVAEDCERWLNAARMLLGKKGMLTPPENLPEPQEPREPATLPCPGKKHDNIFVRCSECMRCGTQKCHRKDEHWPHYVIPGCVVGVERAGQYKAETKPEPHEPKKE